MELGFTVNVKDWLVLALAAGAVVLALRKMGGAPVTETQYWTTGAMQAPGADVGMVWI